MTNKWLNSTGLKAETEGLIIAAQDQSLKTRWYQHNIIKDGTDSKCRACGQFDETIDHIVSGCPVLAKTEYINRHNKVAALVHWKICKKYNIETSTNWYKHTPQTVTKKENITILWDMPIQTDRQIKANKPDIVIQNNITKRCTIIDIAVPSERNTSLSFSGKISKYKDLEIEIRRMWGMTTTIIPVIIGSLGLIKSGSQNIISQIPGNINLFELQKSALLGTAHILRRQLSITYYLMYMYYI